MTTLPDLLGRAVDRWQHEALVVDDKRLSFAALEVRARTRARELRGLGVGPHDHVGILGGNSVDYLVSIFAISALGAVPVPINHRFSSAELAHVVPDARLRVILVADAAGGRSFASTLVAALPGLERQEAERLRLPDAAELRQIVRLDDISTPGMLDRAALAARAADASAAEIDQLQAAISVRDVGMIIYTSGTTSKPKGCIVLHEGLTRTAFTVAGERFLFSPADRVWDPLPYCHLSSLVILFACLAGGATFVSSARFEPGAALAQLAAEGCTFAYPCFDTISAALQAHPDFPSTDLSALRALVTIGVPERLQALQQGWSHAVQLGAYGATEYSGVLCFNRLDDSLEQRIGSCGPPIPGMEVRIIDPETGVDLPPGERGELLCRGYGVFSGYYRDGEATNRVLSADGWMRSGDLAACSEDGYVSYYGRLKDMLKVGGENVAASEIEAVLLAHPDVREAKVVAAPDDTYTEVPAAFVEVRDGAELDEQTILEFCQFRLATFKQPRYVRFVREWPMSGTKIMKVPLREQIAVELSTHS